jgi:hypothetical protein
MTRTWWPRRQIVVVALIVALTSVAASLMVKLTRPQPFANATLGSEWQCNRTLLILTTCVRNTFEKSQPQSVQGRNLTT